MEGTAPTPPPDPTPLVDKEGVGLVLFLIKPRLIGLNGGSEDDNEDPGYCV